MNARVAERLLARGEAGGGGAAGGEREAVPWHVLEVDDVCRDGEGLVEAVRRLNEERWSEEKRLGRTRERVVGAGNEETGFVYV